MTPDHWNRICFALEGIELQLKRIGEVLEKLTQAQVGEVKPGGLGVCSDPCAEGCYHTEAHHKKNCQIHIRWVPVKEPK